MKLKEAVNENCGECGRFKRTIQDESFGCDNCKKPIDNLLQNKDNKHRRYLEIGVFFEHDRETEHLQLCSWKCVLEKLPKIKTDYFVTLPYLTFDNTLEKGIRGQDLLKLLRQIR